MRRQMYVCADKPWERGWCAKAWPGHDFRSLEMASLLYVQTTASAFLMSQTHRRFLLITIPSRMACSSQPFSVKDDVLCHRPDIALFSSRVVYLQLFPGPIPHDIPNHEKPFLVSQEISIIRPRNQGIIMIAIVRYITQSYKLTLHLLFIWELLMTSLGSVGQLEGFMRFVLSINTTGILRVLLHESNYSP